MLGFNNGEKGKAKFVRKVYIFAKTKLLSVGDITKDEARNSCTSDAQIQILSKISCLFYI